MTKRSRIEKVLIRGAKPPRPLTLREYYNAVLKEPIPDHLITVLDHLGEPLK